RRARPGVRSGSPLGLLPAGVPVQARELLQQPLERSPRRGRFWRGPRPARCLCAEPARGGNGPRTDAAPLISSYIARMRKRKTGIKVDPLGALPPWAKKLAERYYTKTVSTFLVYGAVRDFQPAVGPDGKPKYVNLRSFFADELFGSRDLVLFYDRSSGI